MKRTLTAVCWLVLVGSGRAWSQQGAIPWERVPGIKTAEIKEDILTKAAKLLETTPSYGRCTESIAACLRKSSGHSSAGRLARDILVLVANNADATKIQEWVDARRRMAHPDPALIHDIDVTGLPPLGAPEAPVTIVEFSDFQCPFCAQMAPVLEGIIRQSNAKAKLFFKHFPIKGHPRAVAAAKAAVAAGAFGKFWEYNRLLFQNREDLSDEKLLQLAKECGIERDAFVKEMDKEEVINRIADDKLEGLKNMIQGTPAIYINGKELLLDPSAAMIRDRIEEELDIIAQRD